MISVNVPQYYNSTSTGAVVTASSGSNFQFGFDARFLHIENLGAVNLWVKLGSTGVASTADYLITTCSGVNYLQMDNLPTTVNKVSLAATSTATSVFNILAIGG